MRAGIELWRTAPRKVTSVVEARSFLARDPEREPIVVQPDTVLSGPRDRVVWFHRNTTSCWAETMQRQDLPALLSRFQDPLLHRTFGGVLRGTGMEKHDDRTLVSDAPRREFVVTVHTHTAQTATVEEWLRALSWCRPIAWRTNDGGVNFGSAVGSMSAAMPMRKR